jgi:hypothetical protein
MVSVQSYFSSVPQAKGLYSMNLIVSIDFDFSLGFVLVLGLPEYSALSMSSDPSSPLWVQNLYHLI